MPGPTRIEQIGAIDVNAAQSNHFGEARIDVRNALRSVKLWIGVDDALFTGDLVEVFVVEHAAAISSWRAWMNSMRPPARLSAPNTPFAA